MLALTYPVILASASPRRKELFTKLNIPFSVHTLPVKETIPDEIPAKEAAIYLAQRKGQAHRHLAKNTLVITADTVVIANNQILGKPLHPAQAKVTLSQLSGHTHQVITGVCIYLNEQMYSFDVATQVSFGTLSNQEIDYYVATGQGNDKAGAYGIQEWIGLVGIQSIKGSYYNVMGLPTFELYQFLKNNFQ